MTQKILIISRAIHPNLAPRAHRATELAKELVRQGHKVGLAAVLGKYDYSKFEEETGVKVYDLGMSGFEWVSSDIEQRPLSFWRKGVVYLLRRWLLFPDILISRRVVRFLKANIGYDRIITVAVPYSIHWGMAYAKRHVPALKPVVWVSDCGDPFMGNPHNRLPFYFKYVEKWWCRTTDYIAVPTDVAMDAYYPEFRGKIRVIPQGFVFDASLRARYFPNLVPTFAYSGMVYPQKRDPRKFLDYLVARGGDFLFIVYTNKPALFEPYRTLLRGKIELRDYVPHDELIHELSKMDFVINIKNESTVQVPSKLIDYYLTGRPILEVSSAFEEKDVFEEFMKADYQHRVVIESPEQYDIKNVAARFAEL